jgi:predicted Zn-dependent protease
MRCRAARLWALCGTIASTLACGPRPGSELDLARIHQAEGNYEESIGLLRRLLDAAPDAPEASYLLGVALVETGQRGEAVWPLLRAAESEAFAVEAGMLLARTLLETNNPEAAVEATSAVLAKAPDAAAALQVRARARLANREAAAALPDLERLLVAAPEDLDLLAMRASALHALERNEEARLAFERLAAAGAASGHPARAATTCLALASFHARADAAGEAARHATSDCVERFPDDPAVVRVASALFDAAARHDEATQLVRGALARGPASFDLRALLAERLERSGEMDEAEALWREVAEETDAALAWQLLAGHYRRRNRTDAAHAALARAVERAGDEAPDLLRFSEADLLIDLGELERAEERIAELDDPALRQLLHGRIDLARDDPSRALAALDAGILGWPDNPGARALAARAAAELGDAERALSEYRAAFRAGRTANEAGLAAAQLHLALGEPESALVLLEMYLSRRRDAGREPYLLMARAYALRGDTESARRVLERAETLEGAVMPLLLERARVAEREGPGGAAAVLHAAALDWSDPAHEEALALLLDSLGASGKTDRALAVVDAALAAGERARLQDLRGRLLLRAGRDAQARVAFERARELDPASGRARVGLAMVAARGGDLRSARRQLDRALERDDLDPAARYGAAQILLVAGRRSDARSQLEGVLREDPGHASACSDLARLLAEDGGQPARALALAERAVRIDPGERGRATLGYVQSRLASAPGG